MDRVILHSDINACYASVEQLYDPSLVGKAVAVGGSAERRHGIILAKSEEAKRAGVKTGMTIWQAKQCCPALVVVEPHFERYVYFSRKVQEIYADYTDRREPFGIDESWLDITGCVRAGDGVRCANEIRERVKRELGLTVSVGVSWNKAFAKLGSDYKKPDAVTEISRGNYRDVVWPLPVSDLLFAGRQTTKKLERMGVHTIGELAAMPRALLRASFGKAGETLHDYANGMDGSKVLRPDEYPSAKSIGNGTTTPRDMRSRADAVPVVVSLCESVGARLRRAGARGKVITLELRDAESLGWISRRAMLEHPTDCVRELIAVSLSLLDANHRWPEPLRSLSVRAEQLTYSSDEQLDMFTDYKSLDAQRRLDAAMDSLRERYGASAVLRGSMFAAPDMSLPLAQEEYTFVRRLREGGEGQISC